MNRAVKLYTAAVALFLSAGGVFIGCQAANQPGTVQPVAPAYCAAEDELPLTLQEDSYGYKAGQTFCVHIDRVSGS